MTRFFIIGNGFDIAHGLKTSYLNFKNYLENYDSNRLYHNNFPAAVASDAGRIETSYFLHSIISKTVRDRDRWSDFEEALGNIKCNDILKLKNPDGKLLFDETYSFDDVNRVDQVERNYSSFGWSTSRAMGMLSQIFTDWIVDTVDNKMDIITPKDRFLHLIGSNDLFLTFNYTHTLENIYNVKRRQICHIHNAVGQKLIFGHGKDEYEICEVAKECPKLFHDGIEILDGLKKPVDKALNWNKAFFEKCENVTEIYSYGFSYSDVDLPYIELIVSKLPPGCVWHINEYRLGENSDYEGYKAKVIKCGFSGVIDNKFEI